MTQILILGAGMIGTAMAIDLAADSNMRVTIADRDADALQAVATRARVQTRLADLSKPETIRELCGAMDVVIGALSSAIGLQTLQAVIEAGRPYCDISFMPEDATALDGLAKQKGVTAVVDCGVAPGMSNMLAGYGYSQLDRCDRIEIYVGGLPVERRWPFEYKAGFAPSDVLEEYTRPARMVEGGREVVYPALTDIELIDFPQLGTLEAFRTDGLRSLVFTLDVPTMIEKTMRYPGHAMLMKVLRDTGFLSAEPIVVGGHEVVPLEFTSAILFPHWKFGAAEADITVMRVTTTGQKDGRATTLRWDLVDRYDPASDLRSMSRTTGFPATIVARMLASGRIARPGVHPPEVLGQIEGVTEAVLDELRDRGVHFVHTHT